MRQVKKPTDWRSGGEERKRKVKQQYENTICLTKDRTRLTLYPVARDPEIHIMPPKLSHPSKVQFSRCSGTQTLQIPIQLINTLLVISFKFNPREHRHQRRYLPWHYLRRRRRRWDLLQSVLCAVSLPRCPLQAPRRQIRCRHR